MAGEAAPTPLRLRPPRPLLVRPAKVAEPLDLTVLSALWIIYGPLQARAKKLSPV